MAETKKTNATEMVSIMIPLDRTETDDVYVSVAGVGSYLIQRGKTVQVPKEIAEILNESMELEYQNIIKEQKMSSRYAKNSK